MVFDFMDKVKDIRSIFASKDKNAWNDHDLDKTGQENVSKLARIRKCDSDENNSGVKGREETPELIKGNIRDMYARAAQLEGDQYKIDNVDNYVSPTISRIDSTRRIRRMTKRAAEIARASADGNDLIDLDIRTETEEEIANRMNKTYEVVAKQKIIELEDEAEDKKVSPFIAQKNSELRMRGWNQRAARMNEEDQRKRQAEEMENAVVIDGSPKGEFSIKQRIQDGLDKAGKSGRIQ
jgi:hypothetical protein